MSVSRWRVNDAAAAAVAERLLANSEAEKLFDAITQPPASYSNFAGLVAGYHCTVGMQTDEEVRKINADLLAAIRRFKDSLRAFEREAEVGMPSLFDMQCLIEEQDSEHRGLAWTCPPNPFTARLGLLDYLDRLQGDLEIGLTNPAQHRHPFACTQKEGRLPREGKPRAILYVVRVLEMADARPCREWNRLAKICIEELVDEVVTDAELRQRLRAAPIQSEKTPKKRVAKKR